MPYITTKVQALKSYPTYQFYATADSKAVIIDDVFKICILETIRWIRSRLQEFHDLPKELLTPNPEQYSTFSENDLTSFSYNNGFQIDVIYIDAISVWSFRITEPDNGANLGTPNERAAVNGRTFTTEIAFRKHKDCVEIGIQTICSEPADSRADCEVFRPRVVKALAENSELVLHHGGWILDGNPIEVRNNNALERFLMFFSDSMRSLPMIIVADSSTKIKEVQQEISPSSVLSPPTSAYNLSGFGGRDKSFDIEVNAEGLGVKKGITIPKPPTKKTKEKPPTASFQAPQDEIKLPILDYSELAKHLIGFAIVVFVHEKFFKQIHNKAHISVKCGDILIIQHQESVECYTYNQYSNDISAFSRRIRAIAIEMQKRALYNFGDVLFYSDAKLKEYRTKRHQTDSLEEKCRIYKLEISELKAQIKEISQQQTDMQHTAESLRLAQKKIEVLSKELQSQNDEYQKLLEDYVRKDAAYKKTAELIRFYQQQLDVAAQYPTDKNDICNWIEEFFSTELVLSNRAKSEMRKYSGSLDVISLCDGIVFLDAYVKYRRREITEDELKLYAEHRHWDIQGCGKEAIKMHRTDYTVSIDGVSYLLDQHIKHGIRSEELIRIYFCWDDTLQRVIIGSMPCHLATVKNST